MANPELDTVLGKIGAWAAESLSTVEEFRLAYENLVASLPMDDDISTERVGVEGVPAEWIVAPEAQDGRVLLYFHGGGYLLGSMRTHRVMLAHISRAAQARVLGLEYRLAPECPFPAAVDDAVMAYRWLLKNGTSPQSIVIGGDSAGGGLMAAALVALRYLGEPLPAAGVGISPWTDMEATGKSHTTNSEVDPLVKRDRLIEFGKAYLGGKDPRAPLASPIHADLTGLPPLLLQVGSTETLLDDSTLLAQRAREAGVEAEVDVWDGMPHVWHHFAPILPEARQAIERIAEFMRKHIR